jgi:iron complex outermembrane receptor protein
MLFLNRTRKLNATTVNELKVDFNRSFTSNDITIKTPTVNLFGQMTYKFNSIWTSQTNISRSTRKSDGYYSYVMYILPGDSLLNRYVSNQNATGYSTSFQQNFMGDFYVGKMRNRMVAGIDVLHLSAQNNSSAYVLFDTVNAIRSDSKYTQLNKAALDNRFAQNNNPTRNTTNSYTYSAYISNVLNITDQLMAMMSVRLDRFDNKGTLTHRTNTIAGAFAQTAVSPKFGLVYQILKDKVSLFGNYMNGFRNVNTVTQPDGSVSNFKPQQANQWEGGVKAELLNRKITASLSYYNIYVTNITRPDPSRAGFTIQDGNMSSKGFEADISANPLPGLNLIAGYSFNKSLNDKTDAASNGRRPVTAGPEQLMNLWASYQFVQGKLKGWGIGFGGNHASENIITNNSVNGLFTIPAYTVAHSTLFYNAASFRIALKVDNVFNERYFKGWTTVEPQLPRRVSANISFRF